MKVKCVFVLSVLALVSVTPRFAHAVIVINEYQYDDTSTDSLEYVELYNASAAAADISGWTVGGRDASGLNTIVVIPAATSIPAGGFYVIGMSAVPNKNQTVSALFENDAETIELRSGPFATAPLVDAVVYETNKGTSSYGALPADVSAEVGPTPGLWGNLQGNEATTTSLRNSVGRYVDGGDTNVNGRDFGTRPFTPGAPNNTGVVSDYTPPDVDSSTVGATVPNFHGSFVAPRVIDPTVADANNPNAIPASPQGGNAIIAWDPSGGGNSAGSNNVIAANGNFVLSFYLEKTAATGTDNEEWTMGIGTADYTFHNSLVGVPAGTSANGTAGVHWVYTRSSAGTNLNLVDFGAGGPESSRVLIGSADLASVGAGWYTLGIDLNGTAVTGIFDNQTITGMTTAGVLGNFAVGYREAFASNALTRPPTIDAIPEPSAVLFGGLVCGVVGLAAAWRRLFVQNSG